MLVQCYVSVQELCKQNELYKESRRDIVILCKCGLEELDGAVATGLARGEGVT